MALPTPSAPITIPTFSQDRGNVFVDPVTKSTRSVASAYKVTDVCDQDAYVAGQISININQLTADCQIVQAATMSVNVRLPYDSNDAEIVTQLTSLWGAVNTQLGTALQGVNEPATP